MKFRKAFERFMRLKVICLTMTVPFLLAEITNTLIIK